MCGIAGIYYTALNAGEKQEDSTILELLEHRGQKTRGIYEGKDCKLFHTRLQIVDTTAASDQPFVNSDKNQALVYNGEIFNYRQFQKEFSDLKTTGDVEILFRLLQKEGEHCFNKLNGFFAFAFYDENTGNLLICRDRFGVKPLYYYRDENKLAFASELRPL